MPKEKVPFGAGAAVDDALDIAERIDVRNARAHLPSSVVACITGESRGRIPRLESLSASPHLLWGAFHALACVGNTKKNEVLSTRACRQLS
jgi:hypothetical protein